MMNWDGVPSCFGTVGTGVEGIAAFWTPGIGAEPALPTTLAAAAGSSFFSSFLSSFFSSFFFFFFGPSGSPIPSCESANSSSFSSSSLPIFLY